MPKLITPREVDQALAWVPGTAERLARRKWLPHVILPGGSIRFREDEVASFAVPVKPRCGFCGTTARLNTKYRDGKPLCDDCAEAVDESRLPVKSGPGHISKPLTKIMAEIDATRQRKGARR